MPEKGFTNEAASADFSEFAEYPSFFLLYDDYLQRDHALDFFFRRAFEQNAELVCFCDAEHQAGIQAALRQQNPFIQNEDSGRYKTADLKQLFPTSEPSARSVLDWLQKARVEARSRGYSGLWIFLEMGSIATFGETWLREFVAGLERLVSEGDLSLLSAFNCREVPPEPVLELMRYYPAIIQEGRVVRNNYYLSRQDFPDPPCEGFVERTWKRIKAIAGIGKGKKNLQVAYRRDQVFDAILKVAPIGLWLLDKNHRMVFINQNFSKETGISTERYLQTGHYSKIMVPEEGAKCMLSDVRAFAADGPIRCEEELTNVDGTRHSYQIVKSKILSETNEVTGLLGLAIDITDRKKAENDLKEALAVAEDSRDKIDNIIESIADGLIVTDTGNRIVLINDKARELLELGSMTLIGASLGQAVGDLSLVNQINAIYEQDNKQALQTSFQVELPAQNSRLLQARTSRMLNKQNVVTGAITVLRDVTRERELDRIKAEFLSVAAHELRTPLTSILGYLEFCMYPDDFGGFSAEQQREFLEEINSKAELLAKLVSDLLDIGRLEAGKPLPMDVQPIDIERLVRKVVEEFRLQSSRHRFEIQLEKNPVGSVLADEGKLEQVLENLLSNAVKYSPKDSLVRISGLVGDGAYQVSVEDQGIGMTAEQTARVFDKFYRADFSNTAARGLGLGMSIVRQIVESHGGSIWVESEKDRGTRVNFTVPTA
jgi:PAS domain S-box-containing protein